MSISKNHLLAAVVLSCLALGLISPSAMAGLTLECTPGEATANSVWNLNAYWDEGDCMPPVGTDEVDTDGDPSGTGPLDHGLLYDGSSYSIPGVTIGNSRPYADEDEDVTDRTWWPQLNTPAGFVGFSPGIEDNPNSFQPTGYVSLQPNPAGTILKEVSSEPGYGHGLGYTHHETIAIQQLPPGVPQEVMVGSGGHMFQAVIPAQEEIAPDPDAGTPGRPATPAVIVPYNVPLFLVGVWADQAHTYPIKARITLASELYPEQDGMGWPEVNVIELPDGVPEGFQRVYVSYYHPGNEYVLTQQFPLPMPYTVYTYPVNNVTDTTIKVNDAIFGLDPNRTDPNDADPRDDTKPGPNSPLLGVYDNPDLTGTNYYVPGNYDPAGGAGYGVITLNVAAGWEWPEGTTLYVKVATGGVDAVWTAIEEDPDPSAPRRINHMQQSKWMLGTAQDVVATPVDPSAINTVVGVYKLTEMIGQAIDDTHVLANSTMGVVGAVYDTMQMNGTRSADDEITPDDPSAIKMLAAVYPYDDMMGAPVDVRTVDPENSGAIASGKLLSVVPTDTLTGTTADGTTILLLETWDHIGGIMGVYDNENLAGTNYYTAGSTFDSGLGFVTVATPLPGGVTDVWVKAYTTTQLYDPADPAAGFDEETGHITLSADIPEGTEEVYIDYLGANIYDSGNQSYAFVPGDTTITFPSNLPAGIDNFIISYGTDQGAFNLYSSAYPYQIGDSAIVLSTALAADRLDDYVYIIYGVAEDSRLDNDNNLYDLSEPLFFPGSTIIPLRTAVDPDPNEVVPVAIAYQTADIGDSGAYYSKQGLLKLTVPIKDPYDPANNLIDPDSLAVEQGEGVFIDYRPLSKTNMTVGRPVLGVVSNVIPEPADPDYSFESGDVQVDPSGTFTLLEDNVLPVPTFAAAVDYRRIDADAGVMGVIWITNMGNGLIPMYYHHGSACDGANYKVAISAGLNMSNPTQWPSSDWQENTPEINDNLIYDPYMHPMWYAPALVSEGVAPATRKIHAIGYYYKEGEVQFYEDEIEVVVHDARFNEYLPDFSAREMIDYGGTSGDLDYLTCYPQTHGASWPQGYDVDPLTVEPVGEANPTYPDNGSSTTQFVFRIRYHNDNGLPPRPWLPAYSDPWGARASGVVLYLDEQGTGDYMPHFMSLENPWAGGGDDDYNVYIYRIIPGHTRGYSGSPGRYPWQRGYMGDLGTYYDNESYQSLACGNYHYFFACSDDSLTFETGDLVFSYQYNTYAWGNSPSFGDKYSHPLDPSITRSLAGYSEVNRSPHRKYSADGTVSFDYTIYVDRPVRVPGLFEEELEDSVGFSYPWKAENYPVVTCGLRMPSHDDLWVRYDNKIYGNGRFFGTIDPFYRASNPIHPGSHSTGQDAALAETCGVTTKTDNVFRIMYFSQYNEPPIYMKLYINNASEKTGTTADHQYTAYTMYPRADQTQPYDYTQGVWYEYKTKLPAGPHTYYFEAYDGRHVTRFPVRPDRFDYASYDVYTYEIETEGTIRDWWVPTDSLASDRGTEGYVDNDYFPGPYVNNPCVLSEATVTPGTGDEGDHFRYRVKYADPDGQRVYSAYVYIETNDRGDIRKFSMVPETPFLDPAADHSEEYKQGVYYVLDTGTINDFALENGVRRYYFEFTDDWGRQHDLNDIIEGETTRYPAGEDNWISGPVISGNIAPTLSAGSIESQDGTANAATLWTYAVNYRDMNNDEPTLIKVYIGLLQPDAKTILWDDGHTMLPQDPSDNVYSDGKGYYFQTRLGAIDIVAAGKYQPGEKQYFYAFEAFDGVDWATYRSSSNPELRSNAAGAMVLHDADRIDGTHFSLTPLLAQRAAVQTTSAVLPDLPDAIKKIHGVYLTEDLTGDSYYQEFQPGDAEIQLTSNLPAGTTDTWVVYEKVQQGFAVSTTEVQPDSPGVILEVQGVYLSDYMMGINYYDPASADPAFQPGDLSIALTSELSTAVDEFGNPVQVWIKYLAVEPATASAQDAVLASPAPDVLGAQGVYLDDQLTGTNYYDEFQPGDTTVKLTNPLQSGLTRVWVQYEAQSPIVGPLPIDLPAPAGVIPDAEIFKNYASAPTPVLIDDQVNGWISYLDPVNDRGVMFMHGLALLEGQPSAKYVVPDRPRGIAAVEGVYLEPDFSGPNYYDPVKLNTPIVQVASVTAELVDEEMEYFAVPSDKGRISRIRGVYDVPNPTRLDTNYYAGGGLAWQEALPITLGQIWPKDPQDIVSIVGVYATRDDSNPENSYLGDPENPVPYMVVDPALDGEYINLAGTLPDGTTTDALSTVFVRYQQPGGLNLDGRVPLTGPPAGDTIYIYYETETFAAGDTSIPLTDDLPDESMAAAVESQFVVEPADGSDWSGIGVVTGVYTSDDPGSGDTNFYTGTLNPYNPGDSVIRLGSALPAGTSEVYVFYVPLERDVYIKYSDIRFTHQLRGTALQPLSVYSTGFMTYSLTWSYQGVSHYNPDGWTAGNVHIKSNASVDTPAQAMLEELGELVMSGMVGVWLNDRREGINYFNPRETSRHKQNPPHVRYSEYVPDGTNYVWARYFQSGAYHIDRWNRWLVFLNDVEEADRIQASYFFGTKMPQTLGANTAPELSDGGVSPMQGSRGGQYVYTVTYKDLDGPNGQAPAYVRVYIDGEPFDMEPANPDGTPAYREGAVYIYEPDQISGGAHKFHFEASDGAAIAWFDVNGGHRSLLGSFVEPVVDIDGPWVNDLPELSNGQVTPSGTITTRQSVDYTVVYTDADNDAPYFHDPVNDVDIYGQPLGEDVTGSPRLWIDSTINDIGYTGVVAVLEDDPLQPGVKRTIVATDEDGGSPGWTVDQFAGGLMQITNGAIKGRVYLIQSNTTNKLVIATADLAADGVVAGGTSPNTFRINGLLMSKQDPVQQDFTQGVTYKITVPKLGEGTHKFHFTARSREDKPEWLQDIMYAEGETPMPYSVQVRNPVSGDHSGPTVVSTPPEGNVAPELANTASTSLYNGPKVQMGTVTSSTDVDPDHTSDVRTDSDLTVDVYMNANLTGTAYSGTFALASGVTLDSPLGAIPDNSELVMFGIPGMLSGGLGEDLRRVLPDVPGSIANVLGVYAVPELTTDYLQGGTFAGDEITLGAGADSLPLGIEQAYVKYNPVTTTQTGNVTDESGDGFGDTAHPASPDAIAYVIRVHDGAGTEYYNAATAGTPFEPGDATIALDTQLGTETGSVTIDYVPWPPAYMSYFAVHGQEADGFVFASGAPVTFRVRYRDSDNDAPTYHDSVQGFVKVVFNNTTYSAPLLPLETPVGEAFYEDYRLFSATVTDLPEGLLKYHFEASDGYFDTRWPEGTLADETANDYTMRVNYKPVLQGSTVDHTSGMTEFTFSTSYRDWDAVAPEYVRLRLTRVDDPTQVYIYEMQPDPDDDLLYALGVDYLVVVDAQDPVNPLWDPAGDVAYDVAFVARDSIQAADPVEGLQIVVRAENHRPVIKDFEVSPTSGKTNATFTYTAWYYDEDNDKPVATYEGNRVEGLTLVIDPGEAYEQRWLMTRVDEIVDGGGGLPPMPVIVTYDDPDNPVKYEVAISGKQLGPGNHTFTIEGFDGTDYAVSPEGGVVVTKDGPVLLIPYFDLQVNTRDGSAVTDWAVVGEEVLVEGSMLFPFDPIGQTEPPAVINDLTIQVTKPDGTAVALNASVVDIEKDDPVDTENWVGTIEVQYDGYVDPALATGESITLTASGQWKVSAVWPGDSQWNSAATDTTIDGHNDRVEFAVSGPSRTVATSVPEKPDTSSPVIDMITPPMYIGSSDPGVIFGHDRALEMQIVRWSASGNVYFRYGVSGLFPGLAPGYAVWIKPTKSYPAAEPLGISAVQRRTVFDLNVVDLADPQSVAYVSGVYLNEGLTGTNYYVASEALAGERFVHGDEQVILTTPLPIGTTQVWVKYIGYPLTGVDEGWISLDNPAVAKAIDSWGEPRYYHTNYRLIKAQSQAYPLLTDTSGNNVLDEKTKLAKLKPLSIPLEAGWNQIGNIFFNWRRSWQQGTVNVGLTSVVPSNTAAIGRVLGVYLTQSTTGNNYYEPGTAADPYRRGDGVINLTRTLPAGTSTVYVRYEAYPREDVGIPIEQIRVSYLGETKTLSEAKVAGWIHNYAFRYDSYLHDYVLVHPTMTGAERVLKAWSGYWIRAFVNCWIEIDPNTTYSGEQAAGVSAAGLAREEAAAEGFDVPPPIPE